MKVEIGKLLSPEFIFKIRQEKLSEIIKQILSSDERYTQTENVQISQ